MPNIACSYTKKTGAGHAKSLPKEKNSNFVLLIVGQVNDVLNSRYFFIHLGLSVKRGEGVWQQKGRAAKSAA